jgi:hypothetical protein
MANPKPSLYHKNVIGFLSYIFKIYVRSNVILISLFQTSQTIWADTGRTRNLVEGRLGHSGCYRRWIFRR